MTEEVSLKNTLQNIDKKLEELVGKKELQEVSFWNKWKFWQNLTKGNIKRNWVNIVYISDNKNLRILKAPIDENVIMIDNIPHVVNASDIMLHKGKPTIIVPSWSLTPFSPSQNITETNNAGNSTRGWEYVMNYLKKTEIKAIKNAGAMMWIIGGIVVIGGLYYIIKSGWFS